jgi:hypothetical protein
MGLGTVAGGGGVGDGVDATVVSPKDGTAKSVRRTNTVVHVFHPRISKARDVKKVIV